ncbi:MAG: hypothetical protein AAGI10_00010 [Pseudomonadota bacterium]
MNLALNAMAWQLGIRGAQLLVLLYLPILTPYLHATSEGLMAECAVLGFCVFAVQRRMVIGLVPMAGLEAFDLIRAFQGGFQAANIANLLSAIFAFVAICGAVHMVSDLRRRTNDPRDARPRHATGTRIDPDPV